MRGMIFLSAWRRKWKNRGHTEEDDERRKRSNLNDRIDRG
tara:strand:+ start:74 stop:193 length:120 start_codon:yes stop_codon:yes gene_type:complete